MINFDRHTLKNGLTLLVHSSDSSEITAMNLLYRVGARDEKEDKTGFAHLFEHLMFGGSKNIPVYDGPLQKAGGENNAFTNNDYTNYYLTLPNYNLETGFWLESDRMLELDFSEKNLEVQRSVVIEEFKQRYLNQPYGDIWLHLRPLAYKVHPYRWATIGKNIDHILEARMPDVRDFFNSYYGPNNAILCICGNVNTKEVVRLTDKWFGSIPARPLLDKEIPMEPRQPEKRELEIQKDVPYDSIYKVFHMPGRKDEQFHVVDLISDIMGNGLSSRLHQKLVKEEKMFGEINAYISGSLDPGLFVVSGTLMKGIHVKEAEKRIDEELGRLSQEKVKNRELEKVKNRVETSYVYSGITNLSKAMNLSFFEMLGDAGDINSEIDKYRSVTTEQIFETAGPLFSPENSSVLYYLSKAEK